MNPVTIEVELDHGRVIPRGAEALPETGLGLLTLLSDSTETTPRASIHGFLEKWTGAFGIIRQADDDPRLAYLLGKHAK